MKIRDNVILMEQDEYDNYLEGRTDLIGEPGIDYATSGYIANADEEPQDIGELTTASSIDLYTMNQNIINQLPVYTDEDIDRAEDTIHDWIYNGHRANYYMLLCKELSYYTLFHSVDNCLIEEDFIRELWDVCSYLGPIHDISIDDNDAIAIWAEWEDTGVHCFYLFPYDKGVVEF